MEQTYFHVIPVDDDPYILVVLVDGGAITVKSYDTIETVIKKVKEQQTNRMRKMEAEKRRYMYGEGVGFNGGSRLGNAVQADEAATPSDEIPF
jgi:hypothetical protein